jgi:hypothetical protein
MKMMKLDGTKVELTEQDEKDYNDISQVDTDVFTYEREITRKLKSVEEKRKRLRDKGIVI